MEEETEGSGVVGMMDLSKRKKSILVGVNVEGKYDVYISKDGTEAYLYSGTKNEHWNNPKYWDRFYPPIEFPRKKLRKVL